MVNVEGARDHDNRRVRRHQEVHRVELRGEQDLVGPLYHEDSEDASDVAAVQHQRGEVVGRRHDHANKPSALGVGQVEVPLLVRADLRLAAHRWPMVAAHRWPMVAAHRWPRRA